MIQLVEYDEQAEGLISDVAWASVLVKERKGPAARIKKRYSYLSAKEFARRWIAALYCVTKYLSVKMDWTLTPDANFEAPHFFLEGISCKVRMPTYLDPMMKFDRLDLIRVKLVFLCTEPGERKVAIHGCVSYQRFEKESQLTTLPGQKDPCLIMKASQMTPVDSWRKEASWKPDGQMGLPL